MNHGMDGDYLKTKQNKTKNPKNIKIIKECWGRGAPDCRVKTSVRGRWASLRKNLPDKNQRVNTRKRYILAR